MLARLPADAIDAALLCRYLLQLIRYCPCLIDFAGAAEAFAEAVAIARRCLRGAFADTRQHAAHVAEPPLPPASMPDIRLCLCRRACTLPSLRCCFSLLPRCRQADATPYLAVRPADARLLR